MVKATAIDPSRLDENGVLRMEGPARVFVSETKRDGGDQGGPHPAGRRARADRHRADGHGHGGDLPGHRGAEAAAVRPRGGAPHGRAVLRRLHRRVHRPHRPGGAGRGTDRQGPGRRPHPHPHRSRRGERRPGGRGRAPLHRRGRRLGAGEPDDTERPRRPRPAARGHAPLGRAAAGRRRDVEGAACTTWTGSSRPSRRARRRWRSPRPEPRVSARAAPRDPTGGARGAAGRGPGATAPAATRPSRAVAPVTTSAAATARVGTAGQAWSGTRPRSRRPARTRSARALVPNCISTAMLDRAKSSPSSPRLTIVATTSHVTATARIGTPFGEVLSRSNSVRPPEERAER